MTKPSREDVIKLMDEVGAGPHHIRPDNYKGVIDIFERFAAAMYAAGAEAMRERAIEVCEAGIDPMLPDMYETACRTSLSLIRALPITPTNTEGEQDADV